MLSKASRGSNMLLDYAQQEVAKKERIIVENSDWLGLVPYWATWPYETMILPRNRHVLRWDWIQIFRWWVLYCLQDDWPDWGWKTEFSRYHEAADNQIWQPFWVQLPLLHGENSIIPKVKLNFFMTIFSSFRLFETFEPLYFVSVHKLGPYTLCLFTNWANKTLLDARNEFTVYTKHS